MVHQFQLGGYNIVLDVCSGSIHVVDEVAYDAIALYEQLPRQELAEKLLETFGGRPGVDRGEIAACLDDIEALKKAGKLFTPDTFAPLAGKAVGTVEV